MKLAGISSTCQGATDLRDLMEASFVAFPRRCLH